MKKYAVCFCCDKNYYEYLIVAIQSLLDNNITLSLKIYLVSDDLDPVEIKFIFDLVDSYKQLFFYINLPQNQYNNFKTTDMFSRAMYYRLSIPNYVDEDIVLYLDSDVIINNSILDIFELNLENCIIGAVEDIGYISYRSLSLNPENGYFNSGVMLINNVLWRSENITNKAISLLEKKSYEFQYPDQDALNILLQNKWRKIDPKFNQQASFFYKDNQKNGKIIFGKSFETAKKNPVIIHFSGGKKPWNTTSTHPFRNKYWYYYSKTKFFQPYPKDFSILNYLKYLIKITFRIKN